VVTASVEPKRAAETVRVVAAELLGARQPLPAAEVAKGREYLKGRLQLRMEDTGAVASWLGRQELLRQRILTVDEVLARLDRVGVEDLQRVAEDLFRPDLFNLAVVGPFRSPSRFEAALG
jgi:predicted Zn-dependent peptidase